MYFLTNEIMTIVPIPLKCQFENLYLDKRNCDNRPQSFKMSIQKSLFGQMTIVLNPNHRQLFKMSIRKFIFGQNKL